MNRTGLGEPGFEAKASLGELPQDLNVLKGALSLVNPRAHGVQHDAEYSQRIKSNIERISNWSL